MDKPQEKQSGAAKNSVYRYIFEIDPGEEICCRVETHPQEASVSTAFSPPNWARLGYHQCGCCPLTPGPSVYCPAATSVSGLLTEFGNKVSHSRCKVTCISPTRKVSKETTIQDGLSSLLGLVLTVSGCPVLAFFEPLAHFHLPFATVEETIFRTSAVYLLSQYYRKNDQTVDQVNGAYSSFSLEEMANHYQQVKQVYKGILERIKIVAQQDADRNALITLTTLAQILEMEIEANLDSLRPIFANLPTGRSKDPPP